MRRGYKVVCNTAAGRHRYMNLLIPYVLDNDIVDRYDIWVNTLNPVDLRFFELLAQKYSKINHSRYCIWFKPNQIIIQLDIYSIFFCTIFIKLK